MVDNYSKWLRCRKPTTAITINFLHELFASFGFVDCLVSDNATQFTSSEFKEFCETFQIKHITTPQYHPRSNGQAERFVDTLKRALKKAYSSPTEKSLQQFLQVYRITANPKIPETRSPAEAMFGRKIRSVFEKLLPKQTLQNTTSTVLLKRFNLSGKVYFKHFRNNVFFWELGKLTQRIGNVTYIIQSPKFKHKRHVNQIRKRTSEDLMDLPQRKRKQLKPSTTHLISNFPKPCQNHDALVGKGNSRTIFWSVQRKRDTDFTCRSNQLGRRVMWRNHLLMDSTTLHNTGRRSNTKSV